MHRYRLVEEVLIPLIRNIRKYIPNAHILIGGKGGLFGSFVRLKSEDSNSPFTLLGLIPYTKLAKYIAACDVLLCPIDPSYRFTKNSLWLKILESLAVGRPIIATQTNTRDRDFKNVQGIIWTGSDVEAFYSTLKEVHDKYQLYLSLAEGQASDFQRYSISYTISKIVDRMVTLI